MNIFSDCTIALRLVLRAKILVLAVGASIVLILAALLSAYFGGRQLATVAMDVGLSVIRLLLPLLIVLSVQELLSREFDRRYYLNTLAYPRGRDELLFCRFASVLLLVLFFLLVLASLLSGLVYLVADIYPQATPVSLGVPYVIVISFVFVDMLVLASLAVFLAIVASTSSFVLIGTFGFMLVARSYGGIVDLLHRDEVGLVSNVEGYRTGLGALGYFFPDLGALDVRMVALYGRIEFLPVDWPWILLSCIGYAIALLVAALWVLHNKRFV